MVIFLSILPILAAVAGQEGQERPRGGSQDRLEGIPAGRTRLVDLAYTINDHLPAWPGDVQPYIATDNATVVKDGYFTRRFSMLEHYGTHLDAPVHFPPGKTTVDAIPARQLFGPAVVVDIHKQAAQDADYALSPADISWWETRHGRIPAGAIVLARTGWAARWTDAARYRNQDSAGLMHSPGFSVEAVRELIARKVSGIGIDTMSADIGATRSYPVHSLALPAGLYQLENLADLSSLPEVGAFLIVAPIKLEGGSGGPCRVFAVLP